MMLESWILFLPRTNISSKNKVTGSVYPIVFPWVLIAYQDKMMFLIQLYLELDFICDMSRLVEIFIVLHMLQESSCVFNFN